MIGIFVELALSWVLVWLFQKKDLGVLGFRPTGKRIGSFFLFLLITAACCLSGYFLHMAFGARWKLNPHPSLMTILDGLWWHLRSVIYEELIFRGALLYILIKRIGPKSAIVISATGFGIYHWFSFNVWGQPVNMIYTFMTTGLMGLLLAWAYAKTFSLYIPMGIHFGWNGMTMLFGNGPIENSAFVSAPPAYIVTVPGLVGFFIIYFPFMLMLSINFLLVRKQRQQQEDKNMRISFSRS
jgi:membrane protease YdiL (CAAX protease family)